MNTFFKCIANYNPEDFTELENSIINDINSNIYNFVNSKTISDFCLEKMYTVSSVDKIAKKLGYKTASIMKIEVTKMFYEKRQILNEIEFSNHKNESINEDRSKFLINYLNQSALGLFNLNWNIIDKFKNEIINKKTIYLLNSDDIFTISTFQLICNLFKKNFILINSEYRLEYFSQFGFDKDSLLILTKMYKPINNFELTAINLFNKSNIPIYLISSTHDIIKINDLDKRNRTKIIIGNFDHGVNKHIDDIANYKILYDQVMNIINLEVFLVLSKKVFKK